MGKYKMRWSEVKKLGYIPEEYEKSQPSNTAQDISPEPPQKSEKLEQETTQKVSPTTDKGEEKVVKSFKKTAKNVEKKSEDK